MADLRVNKINHDFINNGMTINDQRLRISDYPDFVKNFHKKIWQKQYISKYDFFLMSFFLIICYTSHTYNINFFTQCVKIQFNIC